MKSVGVQTMKRRHILVGTTTLDGKLHWEIVRRVAWPNEHEGFAIEFSYCEYGLPESGQLELAFVLKNNGVDWLWLSEKRWFLDIEAMLCKLPNITDFAWFRGKLEVKPMVENRDAHHRRILFEMTEEYMKENMPKRIFLSHKGADKTRVRNFSDTLKALGFDPWLDEDAMPAGTKLERGLQQGMKDSCASVFFLTSHYKDDGYLAAEIDYAIAEKRQKGEKFAIVALVFDEGACVPELLKPYVWKKPNNDLEALREILLGLPLKLPLPEWKLEVGRS